MRLEELGLIGNGQFAALVAASGDVVWCCLPRFDSDPVFATLLDEQEGGAFTIAPADGKPGVQEYLPNTNVLCTTFRGAQGSFRVIDFAPRFELHNAWFQTVRTLTSWSIKPKWKSMRGHRNAMWQGVLDFLGKRGGPMPQ